MPKLKGRNFLALRGESLSALLFVRFPSFCCMRSLSVLARFSLHSLPPPLLQPASNIFDRTRPHLGRHHRASGCNFLAPSHSHASPKLRPLSASEIMQLERSPTGTHPLSSLYSRLSFRCRSHFAVECTLRASRSISKLATRTIGTHTRRACLKSA